MGEAKSSSGSSPESSRRIGPADTGQGPSQSTNPEPLESSGHRSHASHGSHESADHEHGHGGIGKYIAVFVALCLLTGASFLTYFEFWDNNVPPAISWAFMMAVSCTKAMLVILFFMHLLWEANWKYVLTIPAAMMSMFLILMLVPDVGCRASNYSRERWLHAAEPAEEHMVTHDSGAGAQQGEARSHGAAAGAH